MPPKKTKDSDGSDTSTTSNLETREGRRLNEISGKLSLILQAIESLSKTIQESIQPCTNNDQSSIKPAIEKMTDVLTNLSQNMTETSQQVNLSSGNTQPNLIEEEALKIKTRISNVWEFKLQKRRDAFWGMVKNGGHKDTYSKWINSNDMVVPKYLQWKEFRNEPEEQKKIREIAVKKDFETEIQLQGLRAERHQERCKEIDDFMTKLIDEKAQGEIAKHLKELWASQVKLNETISKRRWSKNERWLQQYERNFRIQYKNKSPFFKPEDDDEKQFRNREYQPKPTYAQAARTNPQRNIRQADI